MERALRCGLILLLAAAVVLAPAMAAAQRAIPVQFTGEVLWIAGQKMAVAAQGRTVGVDLGQVPLDAYQGLAPGASVAVSGVWLDGDRVIASAVQPVPTSPVPPERTR